MIAIKHWNAGERWARTRIACCKPCKATPRLILKMLPCLPIWFNLPWYPLKWVSPHLDGTPAVEKATIEPEKSNTSSILLLVVSCLLMLAFAGAFAYVMLVRNKKKGSRTREPDVAEYNVSAMKEAQEISKKTEFTDYQEGDMGAAIAQFMTTYMIGDDLYDDSFSIDSPSGEFLGECGVGISDTIGVGDPKKVTAFEVWLFDKNDIQTITKVLMSQHAYGDPTISQRLASKGEPILLSPGESVWLETATLKLEARVVDMNYGQGALPAGSYFERMTLELAVWPK